MYSVIETHFHTIASGHAYSTVLEGVAYAKKIWDEGTGNHGSWPGNAWRSSFMAFWKPGCNGRGNRRH